MSVLHWQSLPTLVSGSARAPNIITIDSVIAGILNMSLLLKSSSRSISLCNPQYCAIVHRRNSHLTSREAVPQPCLAAAERLALCVKIDAGEFCLLRWRLFPRHLREDKAIRPLRRSEREEESQNQKESAAFAKRVTACYLKDEVRPKLRLRGIRSQHPAPMLPIIDCYFYGGGHAQAGR